jgi:hypothetical protein
VSHVIYLDLGPTSDFRGYPSQIAGEKVCVLSPRAADDHAVQERVRQHMKGQGRDCRTCGGCPIGARPVEE